MRLNGCVVFTNNKTIGNMDVIDVVRSFRGQCRNDFLQFCIGRGLKKATDLHDEMCFENYKPYITFYKKWLLSSITFKQPTYNEPAFYNFTENEGFYNEYASLEETAKIIFKFPFSDYFHYLNQDGIIYIQLKTIKVRECPEIAHICLCILPEYITSCENYEN